MFILISHYLKFSEKRNISTNLILFYFKKLYFFRAYVKRWQENRFSCYHNLNFCLPSIQKLPPGTLERVACEFQMSIFNSRMSTRNSRKATWNFRMSTCKSKMSTWYSRMSTFILECLSGNPEYLPRIYLEPIICPATELHDTSLLVEGEVLDVHFAGRMVDCRGLPFN